MLLTLKFEKSLDFLPHPGETQLCLDLLDASPLRQFYTITLIRLKEGSKDEIQSRDIRSGEFLKDGSLASKQRELFNVFGAALIAAMPQKEEQP